MTPKEKIWVLTITVFTIIFVQSASQYVADFNTNKPRNFIYNTYPYDTMINVVVNDTTEQILAFEEASDEWRGYPTRVHVSSRDNISEDYPLFITAQQQKGVLSWELPLVVRARRTLRYGDMARTLCPHDAAAPPNATRGTRPLVRVATARARNVSVDIKLRRVRDFYVQVGKDVKAVVTPSTPKYYYFSFATDPYNSSNGFLPRFNYTVPKSVILMIESDDDVCAVVSIQNNSCPVFDNEQDILYQGYRLSVTTRGGITLTQSMFPEGFYVVLMVLQSDEECSGTSGAELPHGSRWLVGPTNAEGRTKSFTLRVVPTISYVEYLYGALVALALPVLAALVALLVALPYTFTLMVEDTPGQSSPSAVEEGPIINENDNEDEADRDVLEAWSLPGALTLATLSRAKETHARRSNRYFWSSVTVALVYALPVVQLLLTYQHMVFQTGDQDLCYYNFLCAHPLAGLSDFNHVYSNVGYVVLGLAFMGLVRRHQRATAHLQETGIPQHYGLQYSLGAALVMEGLLSACYHLCPNKMNFQFDSSFMYVTAVLCMVKLYQGRHPDVNASAHSTFLLLAFLMCIGVVGVLHPSISFWVLFTMLHLFTCAVITLKIYYVGQFKLERGMCARWRRGARGGAARAWRALVPRYRARAALLAVAALANVALAAYGMYNHSGDVARHLLAVLLGNTLLYTLFYLGMKLAHRERILPHTWFYCLAAHLAWFLALKLFLDSKTKWSETPAHSRQHNGACELLQFYDSHDLWHLVSAAALFLSFNMLLTVDDALLHTPRHLIPVF